MESRAAEIRFTEKGPRPAIEIAVPYGTTLAETFKLQKFLSKDLIRKLSPRGCDNCNSGVDIFIHEMFENVIRVDLESMEQLH